MRRVLSYVLIGLGVFAVALGLLLRVGVEPQLAKVPLDIDKVSVAQGSGVTSLVVAEVDDVPTPQIRHDLNVTSTTHVTGDLTQPEVEEGGDVAAWVEAIKTTDDASGILIDASLRENCLDRPTDPDTVQQPGLSFKFPFGTEQRSYQTYDLSLRKTVEARFDGEDTVQGLDVYRFVSETKSARIGQEEGPGSLIV